MLEAIVEHNVHVRVHMYIFSEQICMFGYLKTPDIMLSIVSSKKLDWTHTFDTYCISSDIDTKLSYSELSCLTDQLLCWF